MFTKEIRIMRLQNRIDLLNGRNKENSKIVKKLQRQLRNLRAAD